MQEADTFLGYEMNDEACIPRFSSVLLNWYPGNCFVARNERFAARTEIFSKKVRYQNHAFSRVRIEKIFCYFNHLMYLAYWFEKYTLEVTAIFSSVFTIFSNSA